MATYSPIEGRADELTGRQAEADGLDRLLRAVRAGDSQVLVLRGEPGVGKTALLDYLAEHAEKFTVVRAAGVQSEMELAFAGLHQLLAPMLGRLERLPEPQRDALRTALGTGSGPPPERFLVALAVLTLLSDGAEDDPLLCIVDDEQWVDRASAQVLAFVARRLHAESVGLVFAARARSDELAGLPELVLEGLGDEDARALLDSVLVAPMDARVRDQLLSETHGNPLALLEFARAGTPAERAGGFTMPGGAALATTIEESFRRRVKALPEPSRRLLVLAAADPTGEPLLVWRAADRLGIPAEAATAAAEADLLEIGARVRFRHPLVRSAAYRSARLEERQRTHWALAEATDPEADPDRRAWHLAHAAPGPDDAVAAELERSAARAQSRGGLAAAAAFLERAAELTEDPQHRGERLIAAATGKRDAGALDEALRLLAAADTSPSESLLAARVEQLRGRIALEQQRGGDATRLLGSAAKRLESHDVIAARETHLGALVAAMWVGEPGELRAAASAARAAPRCPETPRAVDLLLDAFAIRLTDGYHAAAPALRLALELLLAPEPEDDLHGSWPYRFAPRASAQVAVELWDADAWHLLAQRLIRRSRREGALANLRFALHLTAVAQILAGELRAAALAVEEDRLIAQATGNPRIPYTDAILAAWRGREAEAEAPIESMSRYARARRLGKFIDTAAFARAVLYNGLGRHDAALGAALPAFDHDHIGLGPFVVPELVEAAARTGELAIANRALAWLAERTRATPTAWALGLEARARALVSEDDSAEEHYRESIRGLGETTVRVELTRSRLLYGEWLRRERRRTDAREQLRLAHTSFAAMGIEAFAERARRELLATGETVRKRSVETRDDLTAQEAQIARFARDGLSNPEIAARLFISSRTVQYHLRKVFIKLDISSRLELERVLPNEPDGSDRA